MTLVDVVWPGMMLQLWPGASPNVVPFAVVAALATGLTNKYSVAVEGLVMKPPFGFAPTAMTGVPPIATTEARPGMGVTGVAAMSVFHKHDDGGRGLNRRERARAAAADGGTSERGC